MYEIRNNRYAHTIFDESYGISIPGGILELQHS
jgi:hypothetical protein